MRHAALASLLAIALAFPAGAQEAKTEQPLGLTKIVVYKHGVGYFEREGKVTGNQQISLSFKSGQMKDLLKSLYAVDLGGGRIATINYDTKDPLSKQLEDVLLQVPEANALTQFLTQVKGARVEATIAGETTRGSVLGIEPVVRQTREGTVSSYKLVLFRDDGKIQPVELLEVTTLKILDEALEKDLRRLLEIHMKAKHADRKSVVLEATGAGERTVRVGYILETPIWKTSYRLLFEDGQKPLLQGWAILENTTDEDWNRVEASFVAGSPMSFIMDLYTAYYPQRSEIPMGVTSAPKAEMMRMLDGAPKPQAAMTRGAGAFGGMAGKDKAAEADDRVEGLAKKAGARRNLAEELEAAVAPAAAGVEVGELFAYQAKEKVSIKRGQAALVPILSERVDGG
ncbi:MAG TPA: DUF4139 domain-containing protein, partial [Planctomycetota bacterium]|nr:DUF4139 domain-containing protein [Planctomycetota bacterium]